MLRRWREPAADADVRPGLNIFAFLVSAAPSTPPDGAARARVGLRRRRDLRRRLHAEVERRRRRGRGRRRNRAARRDRAGRRRRLDRRRRRRRGLDGRRGLHGRGGRRRRLDRRRRRRRGLDRRGRRGRRLDGRGRRRRHRHGRHPGGRVRRAPADVVHVVRVPPHEGHAATRRYSAVVVDVTTYVLPVLRVSQVQRSGRWRTGRSAANDRRRRRTARRRRRRSGVSVLPICAVPLIVGAEFTYWAERQRRPAKSATAATTA